MKRLNILVVGPSIEETPGGMATYIKWQLSEQALSEACDVRYAPSHAEGSLIYKSLYMAEAFIRYLFALPGSDVVHIHSAGRNSFLRKSLYLAFALLLRKKTVLHVHASDMDEVLDGLGKTLSGYFRWCFQRATRVIVLSDYWKTVVESFCPSATVVTVGNPVDTGSIKLSGQRPAGKRVLFMGRLGRRKGVWDLLKAIPDILHEHPDAVFVLDGDGEVDEVRRYIEEAGLGGSVMVKGWVGGEDKLADLRDSHLFVLPSYSEGLPISILEAMAASLPVVSTDIGAIRAVANDDFAVLVKPGDAAALSEAISKLLSDPDRMKEMGQRARSIVERDFDSNVIARKLLCVYEELAQESPRFMIGGVPVDSLSREGAVAAVEGLIAGGGKHLVTTVNPEFVVIANDDPEYRDILASASLATADGTGIVLASDILGGGIKERVTGSDLVMDLAEASDEKGYRMYFLGGTEESAALAREYLGKTYPRLQVEVFAPVFGDFSEEYNETLVEKINAFAPDILCVGLGAPRQEKWIAEHLPGLDVKVAIGTGGSLDFMSGAEKRAPLWMQSAGLEWLYRAIQRPERWRRVAVRLPRFVCLVIKKLARKSFGSKDIDSDRDIRKSQFELEREYARKIMSSPRGSSERAQLLREGYSKSGAFASRRSVPKRKESKAHVMAIVEGQVAKGASLLDVGCGDGAFLASLIKKGYRAKGIDFSREDIEEARQRLKELGAEDSAEVADIINYSSDDKYDLIVMDNVIEHIVPDEVEGVFENFLDMLKDGGKLLILTPHRFSGPHDISREFLPRGARAEGFHLKEYTFTELEEALRNAGFGGVLGFATHPKLLGSLTPGPSVRAARKAGYLEGLFMSGPLSTFLKFSPLLTRLLVALLFPSVCLGVKSGDAS